MKYKSDSSGSGRDGGCSASSKMGVQEIIVRLLPLRSGLRPK